MSPPRDSDPAELRETHAQIAVELRHVAERLLDRGAVPPAYLRRHLTEHALEGGVLGTGYVLDRLLPYLDIARLQAALSRYPAHTREELLMRKLVRQVAHRWQWEYPEVNAFVLELWNALAGSELSLVTRSPWTVRWARQRPEDGVLLGRFALEIRSLASVALPDGRVLVVSVGGDGYLRAWDGDSGLQLFTMTADSSPSCVAVGLGSTGSPVAVTGDREGNVRWWDLDTGMAVSRSTSTHNGPVLAVVLTTLDGELVAVTGGEDGGVHIVDEHGTVGRSLSLAGSVEALAVLPAADGSPLVVAGGNQGLLWRWQLGDGAVEPLAGQPDPVRVLAVAPATGTVICGGAEGWITKWDVERSALRSTPMHVSGRPVDALTVVTGPDGREVVVVCQDRYITTVDTTVDLVGVQGTRRLTTGEGTIAAVAEVRLADGQTTVMTGGRDGTMRQWEIFAEEPFRTVRGEDVGDVTALATAGTGPGDALVVTGTADGTVHGRRAVDSRFVFEAETDSRSPVCTLALLTSPGGTTLVGGTFDGSLYAWGLGNGIVSHEPIRTDGGPVLDSATATVDGHAVFVSVGWQGFVHVVDPSEWPAARTVTAGDADLCCVTAVSTRAGDSVAVIGDVLGTVRVLGLRDLTWLGSVDCAGGAVRCVDATVSPHGGIVVATGHADGAVRGWSLSEDGLLDASGLTIGDTAGGVLCLATTVDARGAVTVAYSGQEPVVRFADLGTGAEVGRPLPVPTTPNAIEWQGLPDPALVVGGRYLAVVEPNPATAS